MAVGAAMTSSQNWKSHVRRLREAGLSAASLDDVFDDDDDAFW